MLGARASRRFRYSRSLHSRTRLSHSPGVDVAHDEGSSTSTSSTVTARRTAFAPTDGSRARSAANTARLNTTGCPCAPRYAARRTAAEDSRDARDERAHRGRLNEGDVDECDEDGIDAGCVDSVETRDEGGQLALIGTRVDHDAPGARGHFPGRFGVLGTKHDGDVIDPAVAQRVENAADERPAFHPQERLVTPHPNGRARRKHNCGNHPPILTAAVAGAVLVAAVRGRITGRSVEAADHARMDRAVIRLVAADRNRRVVVPADVRANWPEPSSSMMWCVTESLFLNCTFRRRPPSPDSG